MIHYMSVRLRLGPFSVSSRGRVGVRVGPVLVSGGGHRRKRFTSSNVRSSSQADFERQIEEGDRWFREQAAAKRRASRSALRHAVYSASAKMLRGHRPPEIVELNSPTQPDDFVSPDRLTLCILCGDKVFSDARFCSACGTSLGLY